jgi:two-component system sensor histidine kinase KdpD
LTASVASVLALDFCFVPPFYTFAVSDIRYLITFAVLLVAGLLVSNLTLRMRKQAETAQERERRTAVLHMMTRSFAFRSGVADIADAAARHLEVLLETEASVLLADDKGMLRHRGGSAGDLVHSERELAVARWVFDHARPAGHGTDTLPAAIGLFMPLAGRKRTMGVLGLALGKRDQPLTPSQRQLLDVFVNHAALALERTLLTEEAERSRVTVETERLRNALLSSVSHDLRTPLATITGAATSMLMQDAQMAETSRRDMLETIREEAERLSHVIGNLLEVTRFESGMVRIRKEPYPLDDLISSAVARVEAPLKHHDLKVSLPDVVVEVPMDPALAEKVLVNLLENAAKYSPAGTRIEIEARRGDGEVEVEVRDRGQGIPPGEEEKIFDSFYRVPGTQDTGGMGLGLAVCRAVVKAHGGHIEARNREGGGTVFRFTLPARDGSAVTAERTKGPVA